MNMNTCPPCTGDCKQGRQCPEAPPASISTMQVVNAAAWVVTAVIGLAFAVHLVLRYLAVQP